MFFLILKFEEDKMVIYEGIKLDKFFRGRFLVFSRLFCLVVSRDFCRLFVIFSLKIAFREIKCLDGSIM